MNSKLPAIDTGASALGNVGEMNQVPILRFDYQVVSVEQYHRATINFYFRGRLPSCGESVCLYLGVDIRIEDQACNPDRDHQ